MSEAEGWAGRSGAAGYQGGRRLEEGGAGVAGVDELVEFNSGKDTSGADGAGVVEIGSFAPLGGAGCAVVFGIADDEGGVGAEEEFGGDFGEDAVLLVNAVDAPQARDSGG